MSESDKTNIEITLKPQEEERNIDFGALGRRFLALKGVAVRLMAAALVIGLLAGVIINLMNLERQVQTVVTFGFDGIEEGLDPNGAAFDISKMASPVVVQPALDALGLSGTVGAEQIRQAMSFEGVIPQDALERISVIQTISEKNPQALEKILEVSYHPIEFRITLNLDQAELDEQSGIALMDAISGEYQSWFLETYGSRAALGISVGEVDYAGYDYSEAADLLGVQFTAAVRYVNTLQAKDPGFRATSTSLTFADLSSNLNTIRSVDMAKLNSLISSNRLTKDGASLEAYYTYQIRMVTNEMEAEQERLAGIQAAIAGYEKSTSVVYGEGGMTTTVIGESQAYDDLIRQQVEASDTVASLRARLKEIQQNYAALTNPEVQVVVAPNAKNYVESLLVTIPAKLARCIDQINETANEYYETVAYRNAFRVLVPTQKVQTVGLTDMARDSLMYAALLEAVVIVILVGITVIATLISGQFYKSSTKGKRVRENAARNGDPSGPKAPGGWEEHRTE